MERRFLDLKTADVRIETRGESASPIITGYGARYYDPTVTGTEYRMVFGRSRVIERIMPGAFNRALAEDDVVGLFNHDPNIVLGRQSAGTMELRADGLGLGYEITPPTSAASVVESIRRGDVKGSSFSFVPRKGGATYRDAEIDGQEWTIRELTDVQLFDVGPVTFPAYRAASSGVRAEDAASLAAEMAEWESSRKSSIARRTAVQVRARLVELGLA